jgi:hypothetical protein
MMLRNLQYVLPDGSIGLIRDLLFRINSLKNIQKALQEGATLLHETLFLVFRVTPTLMQPSLMYIEARIQEILNVWDLGITVDLIDRHVMDFPANYIHPDLIHHLIEENDAYGLLGIDCCQ